MELAEQMAEGLVLDGGLATELERRGHDLSDELWSAGVLLDDPGAIRDVHQAYFAAGAEVAITASYQASFDGLAMRGIEREGAERLLRLSVEIAREAARPINGLVAASIGPYGATLADGSEYVGRYGLTTQQLAEFHLPRIEALLAAGPDLLAIETIPAIEEAEVIVGLLDRLRAPAWVAFSCRDAGHISDGTAFSDAVAVASSSPYVVAVGVNCTPPAFIPHLLDIARGSTSLPLIAYPNIGSTWDAQTRSWRLAGERPDVAADAIRFRGHGATAIGGCCGTTPADIAAIAAAMS